MVLLRRITFSQAINGKTSWVTLSRRLKLFSDVGPEQQPACYLVTHNEQAEYRGLGLYRRRLNLSLWCYSRAIDFPGAPDLDTMLQAFEAVFNVPDNFSSGENTLGGLVYWCRIMGKVFKDPGDLDGQTLMIVPLVVEMP